jgi:hypothetical protein
VMLRFVAERLVEVALEKIPLPILARGVVS